MRKTNPALAGGLLLLVALALFLRVLGNGFGLDLDAPLEFSYHQDESKTLLRSLHMADTLDLNPRWFHYPSLLLYANAAALKLTGFLDANPYFVGRTLTALFGALTVGLAFSLGRRIGGVRAGLVAAVLLAVSFLHVRSSHFVTTDVPMTFFSTASALLATLFLRGGRRAWLWIAFVAAGFATGTKYNGAPVVLLPALAALIASGSPATRRLLDAAVGGAIFALAFLLSTPFLIVELEEFKKWFDYIHEYQKQGQFGFEKPGFVSNLWYLSEYLLRKGIGIPGSLLAVAGAALVLGRKSEARLPAVPLAVFSLAYLIWLATYKTSFTRNMMPIVPFLAVFAGLGLDGLLTRFVDGKIGSPAAGRGVTVLVTALAAVLPLRESVLYDLTVRKSTRTESIPWIVDNLPRGSSIVMEVYGPPLFLTHPRRFRLHRLWSLGRDVGSVQELSGLGADFILSNSGAWEMALSHPGQYPEAERFYRELETAYPILKTFEGDTLDPLYSSISPTIRVYDCRAGRSSR